MEMGSENPLGSIRVHLFLFHQSPLDHSDCFMESLSLELLSLMPSSHLLY